MGSHYEAAIRKPLVTGGKSYHDVTVDIAAQVEGKANTQWWIVFSIALAPFHIAPTEIKTIKNWNKIT